MTGDTTDATGIIYMNTIKNYSIIFLISLTLACSEESSERKKNPASDQVPESSAEMMQQAKTDQGADATVEDGQAPPANELSQVNGSKLSSNQIFQLRGKWQGACQAGDNMAKQLSMEIKDDELIEEQQVFSDIYCKQLTISRITSYGAAISEATISADNIVSLSIVQVSAEANVKAANFIFEANTEKLFGYDDWFVNTPKDISGKSAESNGASIPENGTLMLLEFIFSAKELTFTDDQGSTNVLNKL